MPPKSTAKEPKSDNQWNAFEFLERKGPVDPPAVVACFGPDDFLRRRCLRHAIELSGLDESTIRTFEGDETQWRDVHDELATRSLFELDGRRAARVRNGDSFVTRNRDALERWVAKPVDGALLLLDLRSLPSNTNLYKGIRKVGWLVPAAEPKDDVLIEWILRWGQSQHSLFLSRPQAGVLVDRIGPVCGLIDCELAKLALFADSQGSVSDARVDELVGGWRTQTVWTLADEVAEGRIASALHNIDRLVMAGQSIIGIAAQLSWSLRRYGTAARIIEQQERTGQRPNLQQALDRAGFRPFELTKAEARLRRIGRNRARELLSWLLELELQLKGSHSNDDRARLALESFLFRLSDAKPPTMRSTS